MHIITDYLKSHKIKQLTEEEFAYHIKQAQSGDIESRDKILLSNIGLVIWRMKKIPRFLIETVGYEDIFQEGFIGMFRAIEKFDISLGFKFSTYASLWIKQRMDRYIQDNRCAIRQATYSIELNNAYERIKQDDHTKTSDFYIRLIAKQKGVSPATVRAAIRYKPNVMSCDLQNEYGDTIQIENFLDQDTIKINEINMDKLYKYIGERGTFILKKRSENYTLREISLELGITRERVRQLQEKASTKLRALLRKEI